MTTTAPAPMVFDVTVLNSIEAAEEAWRELEAVGTLTPYQRFDWLKLLLDAGAEPNSRIAIAVVSLAEEIVALLPLAIHQRLGLRTARLLGTDYSNVDWMLATPDFAANATQLRAIVADISTLR